MFKAPFFCTGPGQRQGSVCKGKQPQAAPTAFVFEKLEPRLLLSADAIGAVVSADLLDDDSAQTFDDPRQLDAWLAELADSSPLPLKPATETAALDLSAFAAEDTVEASISFDPAEQWQQQLSSLLDEDSPQRVELVFVDSSVDNYQQLLAGLQTDAAVDYQVTIIDRDADGIAQIGQVLQGQSGIDAIHLVTHGADGAIQLGDTLLNSESLGQYTQQLSSWQSALSADADFLIYGCDVAASDVGDQFLQQLSSLLAVDIAASDDLTGNQQLGADWTLEYQQGAVESSLAFSAQVQQQWQGSLATVVVTTTSWTSTLSNTSSIDALINNPGLDGKISLLEAIRAANNTLNVDGPDQILFDLPGLSTITPFSAIPAITDAVIIDGLTGSGQTTPFIEINGAFTYEEYGFELQASDSTIHGLSIHSFDYGGIWVGGDNNTITGNYIGTGLLGIEQLGNGLSGIRVEGTGNTVGGAAAGLGNLIGNNGQSGVLVYNTSGTNIIGNNIGVNQAGDDAMANGWYGIQIYGSDNNSIGGAAANEGNLISGNSLAGIAIYNGGADDNTVMGNYIGTNASGDAAIANGGEGILLANGADRNIIGGAAAGEGNLISGNATDGIQIKDSISEDNQIIGNLIGTTANGFAALGNADNGILINDSDSNLIGGVDAGEGNVIAGNGLDGIALFFNDATDNIIAGNFIGTDINGTAALGNEQHGVGIYSSASNNTIGGSAAGSGNVIAGNLQAGVYITGNSSTGNTVAGNWIGTNNSNSTNIGNGSYGVQIDNAKDNIIGGASATQRNIISGNGLDGVSISGIQATNNTVQGNYIGLTVGGSGLLANGGAGLSLSGAAWENQIGGSLAGEGNVISGNAADGVAISGFNTRENTLLGNLIGTNAAATGVLANGGSGIRVDDQASENVIGGSGALAGNIISGNSDAGILLDGMFTDSNTVAGNFIGTNAGAVVSLMNGASGILIQNGASNNIIGGASPVFGNTIMFNGQAGVRITENSSSGNSIRSNIIYANSALGIDLGDIGVLANDLGDVDSGANSLQNYPVLTLAEVNAVNITIDGSINTTVDTDVEIDFFYSDSSDSSGNGEAQVYIGSFDSKTDSAGNLVFSENFAMVVPAGKMITATVTTSNGTSEFAANIAATESPNTAPTGSVTITGTIQEDELLMASNTVADVDGISGSISYQWQRGGVDISGATTSSYLLGDLDVGAVITVEANYVDDLGKAESVVSAATLAVVNINDPLAGTVTISGTAEDNAILTASETLTDDDGISGLINLQWQADGVNISGATDTSYQLTDAEVGKVITVVGFYTDDQGTFESTVSAATVAVAEVNDAVTGSVTIAAVAADNDLLTASDTLEDEDGIASISYQWFNDSGAIAGATSINYSVTDSDVGQQLYVQATVTDNLSNVEVKTSNSTEVVTETNDAVTGSVSIAATAADNDVLTASDDFADQDGIGSISYQWFNDSGAITGATSVNYSVTDSDVGQQLYVQATVTDNLSNVEVKTSNSTAVVTDSNDAVTGSVSIAATAADNDVLTASDDFADQDGIGSISYQWFNDSGAIAGATSVNYSVTDSDVGQQLYVQATVTDNLSNVEVKTSNSTAVVTDSNDAVTGSVSIAATAADNDVLTASDDFADQDGIGSISYQWFNDSGAIAGATSVNYSVTDSDVGQQLYVQATVTDNLSNVEVKTSNSTAVVTDSNDAVTGSVSIAATAADNDVLTASDDFADQDGIGSISYQWFNDSGAIAGATSVNYSVTDSDVGQQLYVQATVTDNLDNAEVKTSNSTAAVTDTNDLVTGAVSIAATAADNDVLTASDDFADEDGIASVSYQWFNDDGAIAGATTVNYAVTDSDIGQQLYVQATVTDNLANAEVKTSNATAAVTDTNDPVTGALTIPATAADNDLLSASNSFADEDGITSISYQWFNDSGAIAGATTANYIVTDADVNQQLYLQATVTDNLGNTEVKTSNLTAAVTDTNDPVTGSVSIAGTAADNDLLTASNNFADQDGIAQITYQWFNDTGAIAGASGVNYSVTDSDIGQQLYVQASVTDTLDNTEIKTSNLTAVVTEANDLVTGTITIPATAADNAVLSARQSFADQDGIASISYQWFNDAGAISGATALNYTVTDNDVGQQLFIQATVTDNLGNVEIKSSNQTAAVTDTNDPLLGDVSIAGTATDNEVLTAQQTFSDEDGIDSIAYQWFNDNGAITGATLVNYTVSDSDVGQQLYVQATVLDGAGNSDIKISTATAAVNDVNDPVSGTVTISGTAAEDQLLTASQNLSDQDGLGTITLQWQRNGVDIAGATGSSYQLGDSDVGGTISVTASYTDQGNTFERVVSAATAAVANVNDSPQGSVTVTGTAEVDQLLTASNNLSDADGLGAISYQWQRGGVDIAGATNNTYQVTAADRVSELSVKAIYTDGNNTAEVVNSAGVLVASQLVEELLESSQADNKPKTEASKSAATESATGDGSAAGDGEPATEEASTEDADADQPLVLNADLDLLTGSRTTTNDLNANSLANSGLNGSGIERPRGIENASGINRSASADSSAEQQNIDTLDSTYVSESFTFKGLESSFSSLNDPMSLVGSSHLKNSLDEVQQQMQNNLQLSQKIIGGSVAVSGGLSVGYVVWLVRSGAILSSVMSALPAWRFIDPLPILSAASGGGEGDDESLQSMVSDESGGTSEQEENEDK